MRAEARARFEAGDVDSCGVPAKIRRRSEEKLHDGEALDNLHGSAAKRTLKPDCVSALQRKAHESLREEESGTLSPVLFESRS